MSHVDVAALPLAARPKDKSFTYRVREAAKPFSDWLLALGSALLLVLAFPDFEVWPLAAVGLVPLLFVVAQRPKPLRSFFLGWLTGAVFFYGSCYWLTYSMIHYGGVPTVLAFLFLVPVTLVVGLFPGLFAFVLARAVRRWGTTAMLRGHSLAVAMNGQGWDSLVNCGMRWATPWPTNRH